MEKFTVHTEADSGWADIPDVTINFGKYKGRTVSWLVNHADSYLSWMLANVSGIPDRVREIAKTLRQVNAEERDSYDVLY